MIPVKQTTLHDPDNGKYGDCYRASIASILELPINEVPNFNAIAKSDETIFWDEVTKFMESRGLTILSTQANSGRWLSGDTYHIISGPSPRNNGYHAVVGHNGQIVFDPHPSNDGLVGDPMEWRYEYLVVSTPVPTQTPSNVSANIPFLL